MVVTIFFGGGGGGGGGGTAFALMTREVMEEEYVLEGASLVIMYREWEKNEGSADLCTAWQGKARGRQLNSESSGQVRNVLNFDKKSENEPQLYRSTLQFTFFVFLD